jgi:hypothetical protein
MVHCHKFKIFRRCIKWTCVLYGQNLLDYILFNSWRRDLGGRAFATQTGF